LGALLARKQDEAQARASQAASQPGAERRLDELLVRLQEDKKQSIEALANAMLPGLADALQTAHCLLFMLTRSGELRVRNGSGKGIDELKSRLKIAADFKPTAFHAAIKNNIDVSIADVSKLRDTNLPDDYRRLLPHVTQFVVLPITTSRVSGLLYCDWDSGRSLRQPEMDALKKLRNLFLPYFPQ
jgi:Rad3-related DNA helicase